MSSTSTPNPPAGWYPDPAGSPRSRWWDGSSWSAHYHDPSAPVAAATATATASYPVSAPPYQGLAPSQLRAPEGARFTDLWVWLIIIIPLLPTFALLAVDWSPMFAFDPNDPTSVYTGQLALYTSPAYLAATIGGWLAYALCVLFAVLDWRGLNAAGVPKPFHWAFVFLGGVVYAIGRSVVVKRRTGKGAAVMWGAIASIVLSLIITIVMTVGIFASMYDSLAVLDPYSY